jgi:hypothetical protein
VQAHVVLNGIIVIDSFELHVSLVYYGWGVLLYSLIWVDVSILLLMAHL